MASNRILDLIGEGDPRRGKQRRRVMLTARLSTSSGRYDVQIRDVSASGARVEGDPLPPADAVVVLSRGIFEAYGRVVWVEGQTAGIEFDDPLDETGMMDDLKGLPPRAAAANEVYRRPGLGRSVHPRFSDGKGWIELLPDRH